MSVQSDFMIAVNQLAAERGLDVDEILEAIKLSIKTGFKKDHFQEIEDEKLENESEGDLNVEINEETGAITVYIDKKVVEKVTNPETQISLKDAKKLEPKLRAGDHIEIDITPEGDFGRVAAQTAKQVIMQKLREAEKESQIKKFIDSVGEIETAIVQRMDGDSVLWEVGRATAFMPASEKISNEFYRSGRKYKVLLKEIQQTPKGKAIIVSRSAPDFLKALFKLEVPELTSGTIEIKSIAREAGQRSKIAVKSNADGVDPIGACVGQKGIRIMAVTNELKMGDHEEKLDIILWDEDEIQYIVNSLSPAQVVSTQVIDQEARLIRVVVPDDQLSLAIGKDGQNVRLAAKLTGWNIDIQGQTVKIENHNHDAKKQTEDVVKKESKTKGIKKGKKEEIDALDSLDLTTRVKNVLKQAGICSIEELRKKIDAEQKIDGVGEKTVEKIKEVLNA